MVIKKKKEAKRKTPGKSKRLKKTPEKSSESILWKKALEVVGDGVWDWNIQTGKCLLSKTLENMLGYSEGNLRSRIEEWETRVHPEDKPLVMSDLQAYLDGKSKFYSNEHRLRCKDGSWKWILDRGSVVQFDKMGKPLRMVGTRFDISERKLFEKKINHSQERMNRTQQLAHIGDWERDLNTNELVWSDEMYRLIGYAPGDSRGTYENFLKQVHPGDRQTVINLTANAIKEGRPYSAEYRMVRDDGTIHFMHAIAELSRDLQGNPVRLVGTAQDITERKQMENDLIENEQFTLDVMDSLGSHIAVLDSSGVILRVNEAWRKFANDNSCSGSFFSVVGKNYLSVCTQEALIGISEVLQGKRDCFMMEYDCHSETEKRWFMMNVTKMKGIRQGAVVSHSDITEMKLIEEVLKKARLAADQANHMKDEFLSILSHELRTPLTSILGWIQLLRLGKLNSDKISHGLEAVENSANAQGQLIDDLLDVSRIQAGKLKLEFDLVDPRKVIAAAIDSTRVLASNKSIQIEISIDPSIKSIFADPIRLQQILWNLITNSIKFSPQNGKIWIKVEKVVAFATEQISFQIRDNGKGIKSDFLPIVFDRFTQVDSTTTRAYGGLGLGLSIVKKLTEMHGGSIDVKSEGESKGSTFSILFPVVQITKQNVLDSKIEFDTEFKADSTLQGVRVLLVEDDASTREVFDVLLQSFGAIVKTAASVKEGLVMLEKFEPDVLVSDIAMPVEDGYSMIAKVRALKSELKKTPALALTAFAGSEDIQKMLLAGFQAHLAKPVDSKKLALMIAKLSETLS